MTRTQAYKLFVTKLEPFCKSEQDEMVSLEQLRESALKCTDKLFAVEKDIESLTDFRIVISQNAKTLHDVEDSILDAIDNNEVSDFVESELGFDTVPDYADVFTIDEFREMVKSGCIIDYDGSGHFVNKDGIEYRNTSVLDDELFDDEYLKSNNFVNVAWYNR